MGSLSSTPRESAWARLRALSARELVLLPVAPVLLTAMVVLLPLVGYRRIERAMRRLPRAGAVPPANADARIHATVRMVDLAVSRLPIRTACLSQSLALATLLRAQGVPADVRLGVRPGGVPLDAHAWVEYEGRPLNETPEVVATFSAFRVAPR